MKKLTLLLLLAIPLFTFSQIINIPDDYPTIQEGINMASNSDTILVDTGTYYENINFKGKAITVASNYLISPDSTFIQNTIIDGSQPNHPDSASVVMFISGEDTTSVLCGFTITGGSGIIHQTYGWRGGGGIACIESSAKIASNIIMANVVSDPDWAGGGGIVCVSINGDRENVIINGNIIRNNSIDASNINAFGGGIYSITNTTISNNLIEENSCLSNSLVEGAGIMIEESPGSTLDINVINNIIRNNELHGEKSRGAGLNIYRAGISLINNEIYGNSSLPELSSLGVGVFINGTLNKVLIKNNTIKNNVTSIDLNTSAGGGINIWNALDIEIVLNCNILAENVSKNGGGFYSKNSYNILVVNNLFTTNSSKIGAGISMLIQSNELNDISNKNELTNPLIINNTFYNNEANEEGGAIYLNLSTNTPYFYNNLLWENDAIDGKDIFYKNGTDPILVSFCNINEANITGTWTGSDNINEDPIFILSGNHPYQINDNSPCINKGNPDTTGLKLPLLDLAGEIRFINERVDMGAYEWNWMVGIEESSMPESNHLQVHNYPNPFSTSTTIEYELNKPETVTITFYSQFGRQADVIEERQQKGLNKVIWHANNLPVGIYYYRLIAGDQTFSAKLLLTR